MDQTAANLVKEHFKAHRIHYVGPMIRMMIKIFFVLVQVDEIHLKRDDCVKYAGHIPCDISCAYFVEIAETSKQSR